MPCRLAGEFAWSARMATPRSCTEPMSRRRTFWSECQTLPLAALLLVGCVPMREPPPPTEAIPELVIVTPTVGVPTTPERAIAGRYVVQQGDTLSGIAARFGVSEQALMAANNLRDPNRLFAGQELAIPAPEEAEP